jgi:hypothetical protein
MTGKRKCNSCRKFRLHKEMLQVIERLYLGLWRLRRSALAYFLLPDLWAL